jgi:glycine oxidase
MEVDYLIVGQGLAGSAVALQLQKIGRRIVVIDNRSANSSSRIAAGLFNPITGKKMVKTWKADIVFPYLHEFYRQAETLTSERFFYPMPLYRPFLSVEEQNEWVVKAVEPAYIDYVEHVSLNEKVSGIHNPFGGLLLKQCGFLDTRRYIEAVKNVLKEQSSLLEDEVQFDALEIGEKIRYKNITASKLILCTGVDKNKYVEWLPIRALKGETLSIRTNLSRDVIVNRGVYMVPTEDGAWRVGSTYNFQDKTPGSTSAGRQELEENIKDLLALPFEVTDHQWGFRPTTPDRRPIIGAHPANSSVIIFNGLGTKGVSLAPYFSEVIVHWLEKEGSINKEVDIDRFK